MPIEPWWETNPATTPRQELGMVSPELQNPASRVRYGVPGTPDPDDRLHRPPHRAAPPAPPAGAGQRVFVLQGLGGLGKSTLALHMVRGLLHAGDDLCALWCQDAEEHAGGIAEALVGQFLEYGRKRFGSGWDEVVRQVDRLAGDDPAQRFECFLGMLLRNVERLVVYLDNLESLLVGPGDDVNGSPDPAAFGRWRTPALAALWSALDRFAHDTDTLHVVASCRYRHDDFRRALVPVPLLSPDALFRLMGWFDGLRLLSTERGPGWSGAWPDTPGRSSTPPT